MSTTHFSCPEPTLLPPTSAIYNNCFIFSWLFPPFLFFTPAVDNMAAFSSINLQEHMVALSIFPEAATAGSWCTGQQTVEKGFFQSPNGSYRGGFNAPGDVKDLRDCLDLDDEGDRGNPRILEDQSLSFGEHFEDTSICCLSHVFFPRQSQIWASCGQKTRCHLYLWQCVIFLESWTKKCISASSHFHVAFCKM